MASRLQQLARDTPASRDRYVDFLRAASIMAVIFGHWVIALIWREGGLISVTSAVGKTPGLWLGTWIFQVIPVFFFVGGFSNYVELDAIRERGERRGRSCARGWVDSFDPRSSSLARGRLSRS